MIESSECSLYGLIAYESILRDQIEHMSDVSHVTSVLFGGGNHTVGAKNPLTSKLESCLDVHMYMTYPSLEIPVRVHYTDVTFMSADEHAHYIEDTLIPNIAKMIQACCESSKETGTSTFFVEPAYVNVEFTKYASNCTLSITLEQAGNNTGEIKKVLKLV